MEEELDGVGKVHDLCRWYESIRIAESRVLDKFVLGHTMGQRESGPVFVLSGWSCDDPYKLMVMR